MIWQDNSIAYRKPQGFALMKFLKSFGEPLILTRRQFSLEPSRIGVERSREPTLSGSLGPHFQFDV